MGGGWSSGFRQTSRAQRLGNTVTFVSWQRKIKVKREWLSLEGLLCASLVTSLHVCSWTTLRRTGFSEPRYNPDSWWRLTSRCKSHTPLMVSVCEAQTSRYYWIVFTCTCVHVGPELSTSVDSSFLSLVFSLIWPLFYCSHFWLSLCLGWQKTYKRFRKQISLELFLSWLFTSVWRWFLVLPMLVVFSQTVIVWKHLHSKLIRDNVIYNLWPHRRNCNRKLEEALLFNLSMSCFGC